MKDRALRLARFGRALRAEGVATTLRDELDAAEALTLVDHGDREEVRRALRIALKVPRADFETYDRLFDGFWRGSPEATPVTPRRRPEPPAAPRSRALHWDPDRRRMATEEGASPRGERPGYSPEALLRRKPFDEEWSARDLVRMERLLARLARRLASRRSRRWVPTRGRGRADVRASFRRSLRTSGELLSLARQRDDLVLDDEDTDVVKVVIDQVRDVSRGVRQRMTFIAAGLIVEELPAALGRFIDRVLVTGDEVIERRIKG